MEDILICVSNPQSAENLIKRGVQLQKAFQGKVMVLSVISDKQERLNLEKRFEIEEINRIAKSYNLHFILVEKEKRTLAECIRDIIHTQGRIKQVVIGQTPQSKWSLFTHGSLLHELFRYVDGVDVHVVEVLYVEPLPKLFEEGVSAFLTSKGELSYEYNAGIPGTFYRRRDTDFENGLFYTSGDEKKEIVIVDGKVQK